MNKKDLLWGTVFFITTVVSFVSFTMYVLHIWATQGGI